MTVPQAVLTFVVFVVMVACGGGVADLGPDVGTPTASAGTPAPGGPPTAPAVTPTPAAGRLQTRSITVSNGTVSRPVTAEIAHTAAERQRGLMERTAMGEDEGMLFLFAGDSRGGFWMRNTVLPLTIAYLDASGRIVDLRDGKPFDDTILTPSAPYRNVLEMNQGWFARHGFGIGSVVSLPTDVSPQ